LPVGLKTTMETFIRGTLLGPCPRSLDLLAAYRRRTASRQLISS
jgi:hypothetical protein